MGNTGSSWEEGLIDPYGIWLHRMSERALENYKAEQSQGNQASLHTIAFAMALGELHSRAIVDRLERIAQALEASLRGDTITIWQVLDILHKWAKDWDRERLKIPEGTQASVDIIGAAHDRKTDQWTAEVYSDTSKEVFDMVFTFDENFHIQVLSIELAKED